MPPSPARGADPAFQLPLQGLARPSDEILPDARVPPPVRRSQKASCAGPPCPWRRMALIGRRLGGIGNRLRTPAAMSEATARLARPANPSPATAAARTYSG